MFVQFASALITFACMFGINSKINKNLGQPFPGLVVKPSYSAALAVLCAGLVLLGLITTSALGGCGKAPAVADDEDEDEKVGTSAPRRAGSKKGPVAVVAEAPDVAMEEYKSSQ